MNSLNILDKNIELLARVKSNLQESNKILDENIELLEVEQILNENIELKTKNTELEAKNKKLNIWLNTISMDHDEIIKHYRDYIMYLETIYVEDKHKDNYFKNLYNNQKILNYSDGNWLYRCNICNEINPIAYEEDFDNIDNSITNYPIFKGGEQEHANKYAIEIKYNQKNCDYYINKLIGNLCHCCRDALEHNNTILEKNIKENIEDVNIKTNNIEELFNKTNNLYLFMWQQCEKTNDYIIYLYIDLNNVYDFSYIIKHLEWDFLIDIKKKWKNYNLEIK